MDVPHLLVCWKCFVYQPINIILSYGPAVINFLFMIYIIQMEFRIKIKRMTVIFFLYIQNHIKTWGNIKGYSQSILKFNVLFNCIPYCAFNMFVLVIVKRANVWKRLHKIILTNWVSKYEMMNSNCRFDWKLIAKCS